MLTEFCARADLRWIGSGFAVAATLTFTHIALTAQSDTAPPQVSITAPAANAIVTGSIPVSATASDSVGVAGVQFRLDGAPIGAEDVTAPYSMSWNTVGSADLIFGVAKVAVDPMTMTAGSGFTKRLSVSCASCSGEDMVSEDMIKTSAGPAAATWTFSTAARYLAQMAAFKAAGTPAYVQGAVATRKSASSQIAQAFGSNVTAGRLLVVAVAWQGNSAVSAADTRGNVYSVATLAYDAVNGQSLAILYAANVNGGATTVTASFGGTSPAVRRLEIHEYSGIATTSPLDVTAMNSANGTTPANAITSGSATTTMMSPVSNGSHTLTALARDAAGNTAASAAVTVTVNNGGDTAPPVITAVAASSITSSGATITWTTNEASNSQVDYGLTTAYGSASALTTSQVTSHPIALSGLAATTTYHYRARSRDAAGNLALSSDFTFTTLAGADVTAPVVSMSAPTGGATVSGTVTVNATASDNVGVAGVQFRVDGAPIGAEDVAAPYSIAWNTQGSTDLVFGVTKVIVWPMAITAGSGWTKRLSVNCPGCVGEDMVSEDKVQTAAGAAAATWTFNTPAHYLAQMAAFKATGTPAYVQGAVASSNAPSTTIARAFGASVTAGNLIVVAVAWSGNSALGVTDTRGNVYAVATSAYDAVNGQTLAILYAANAASGATTVTANFGPTPEVQRLAIHEYSGIATTSPLDVTKSNIADGTTTADAITSGSGTTTVTPPVSGSHTLTALARDAAGNTATSAAVIVTVNNGGDITPPVISGVAAASITSSGATISWTTNEASDSQLDYGLTTAYGSISPLNGSLVTTHSMILGALTGNTTYQVRARSRDAAGNLALSGNFVFTTLAADLTSPVVSITAPAANATVSGTVTFSATATDNVAVTGVEFKRGGANVAPEDTVAPYTVAWNTTGAAQGVHTLTAVAWDAAGNQATATRTVTVANALGQVLLAWNANTETDLAGYKVYVGTSSGVYSAPITVGNVISYTVTGLAPGNTYYIMVTAYDQGAAESGASNEVSAIR